MAFQGLKILGTTERPQLMANNRLVRMVIIDILTDLGNSGQLSIPVTEYEKLTDEELAGRISQKALMLDRPQLL